MEIVKENQVAAAEGSPSNAEATSTTQQDKGSNSNNNNSNNNTGTGTGTDTNTTTGMALTAVGSFIKLLPTGTVFIFQFVSPIVTNSGQCTTTNKYLTATLLVVCAFCCMFSSFTDSYTDTTTKQRRYGIVTTNGLWPPPENPDSVDLSGYRLRFGDFVHAALTLLVFAVLGLLDTNTVHCFYPGFESTQKTLLQALPPVIGVLAGGVFMVFPNTRHGIGYPLRTDSNDTSPKSNGGGV